MDRRASHKRNASEVQISFAASANGDTSTSLAEAPTIESFPSLLWDQQKASKRPRTGDYREPHQGSLDGEGDDEAEHSRQDDDDLNSLKVNPSHHPPRSDIDSTSSLGEDDSQARNLPKDKTIQTTPERKGRWVFRRSSSLESISSSVITELSASEVADALGGDGLKLNSSRRRRSGRGSTTSRKQPPMENLLRNMEQWSLSHIRALRRNNVYEDTTTTNNSSEDDRMNHRRAVQVARREVMRTLRRGSSLASSNTSADADKKSNDTDRGMAPTTIPPAAKRRSSAASLNSARTV